MNIQVHTSTRRLVLVAFIVMASTAAFTTWLWLVVDISGQQLHSETLAVAQNQSTAAAEQIAKTIETESVDERADLYSFVLHGNDTITFLAEIESIAAQQHVALTTDSLEVMEGNGLFDTLKLRLSFEGPSENVTQMVYILESLPYLSVPTSFSLRQQATTTAAQMNLDVKLLDYES